MNRRRDERGAALVVTLIFVTAMAAAAVAFLAGRRTDALALRGQLQAVEAQTMLEASLQQAVALLVNRKPRQRVPSELSWQFADVAVHVRIEGEIGKIDLNKADPTVLEGLGMALGLPEDKATAIADAVLDWRDENQLKLGSGAEDRDYGGNGRATSGAADRPFSHPAELRYVLPVDPATGALMAPYVTVYSGTDQPEPRKASAVVRKAMEIARGLHRSDSKQDTADTKTGGSTDGGIGAGSSDAAHSAAQGGLGGGAGSSGLGSSGGSSLSSSGRSSLGNSGSSGLGSSGGSGLGSSGGTQSRIEAGRLDPAGGQASTLSKLERPGETGSAAGSDSTAGRGGATGAEDDTSGAQTLFLDVRFPNGYEAAAKAVVAISAGGAGEEPFVVLDWTPIVGTRSGGT